MNALMMMFRTTKKHMMTFSLILPTVFSKHMYR